MLTRRAVLTGTAAASIAAIASARAVVGAEPSSQSGFDLGFGDLQDGALGAFAKHREGFGVLLKWEGSGAEVFYKETLFDKVEVFFKSFFKGWTPVSSVPLNLLLSLEGAEARFEKVSPHGAEFFIKGENGISVLTTFESNVDGVQIDVAEFSD